MKKKLILMAMVMAMLLVLAACGNKNDAPASAGTSENTSKESEKETGAVESIMGEVADAIEDAAKLQPGDVTNKMYFAEDIFFTSSTPLEFLEWEDYSTGFSSYSTGIDHTSPITLCLGDEYAFGYELINSLNTPEGLYRGGMAGGSIDLYFEAEGKDGRKYGIYVGASEPTEEHIAFFLQLVEDFLDSGIAVESKMSDIQYDPAVLSETNTKNFFTSPDAIAAD